MGGTRIFEFGGGIEEGKGGGHGVGAKENRCYRTFNSGKLAASALAVSGRK